MGVDHHDSSLGKHSEVDLGVGDELIVVEGLASSYLVDHPIQVNDAAIETSSRIGCTPTKLCSTLPACRVDDKCKRCSLNNLFWKRHHFGNVFTGTCEQRFPLLDFVRQF